MSTHSAHPREFAHAHRAPPRKKKSRLGEKAWWPWVKRVLTFAFFALVAWYSIRYARNVDWGEVWRTILDTPRNVLLMAAGCVMASYAIYCSFDLLGRHYTGHKLRAF